MAGRAQDLRGIQRVTGPKLHLVTSLISLALLACEGSLGALDVVPLPDASEVNPPSSRGSSGCCRFNSADRARRC